MIKITNPKTFAEGFEEFIYSRRMNGCRDITIKHYENSIHVFRLYFDKIRMDELEESTVHKFFSHLKKRGISDQTISTLPRKNYLPYNRTEVRNNVENYVYYVTI